MILGTIVLEQQTITFTVIDHENGPTRVMYSVADRQTGEVEHCDVGGREFMIALGIALSFDGDVPSDASKAWKEAESVQPLSPNLRFIP